MVEEETEVTEERGVGPKERSFRKGWLMVSEAIMIKQIMSLKKKKRLFAWRLRQGNTQRREGGHISRNHKVYFGEGFYTFVSFRSRDKDFTKKSHLAGSLHCKNRRQGGNILSPMLIIINFWTTSRLTNSNLQLWVS